MRCVLCSLIGWIFVLTPTASWAGSITYNIALNTAPLIGHAAGPFSIEFQLNDGSGMGDASNTALLSNFIFGGGAAAGVPTLTGGASGNAGNSVTLSDSSFFNQFIQQFTPGSQLGFRLALSTNLDTGGVPDQFTFAILDHTGVELPTSASFFDVFVQLDIDSVNPLVQTFGTDTNRSPAAGGGPIDIVAPAATQVGAGMPEPGTGALLAITLSAMLGDKYRRAHYRKAKIKTSVTAQSAMAK